LRSSYLFVLGGGVINWSLIHISSLVIRLKRSLTLAAIFLHFLSGMCFFFFPLASANVNYLRSFWWHLLQQILLAVNTIHEERIVHSDLKPANFLLVKGSLKLIDFGIAKAIMSDTTNIQRDSQVMLVFHLFFLILTHLCICYDWTGYLSYLVALCCFFTMHVSLASLNAVHNCMVYALH